MGCGSKNLKSLDARLFQVAFQAILLTVGVLLRDFSLLPAQMALAIASATATQAFWLKVFKLKNVGYLSPLITGFGLSLLLRADSLWLHPLVGLHCLACPAHGFRRGNGATIWGLPSG